MHEGTKSSTGSTLLFGDVNVFRSVFEEDVIITSAFLDLFQLRFVVPGFLKMKNVGFFV